MRAVFLDRDGTVNIGIPVYERVDSVEKVVLLPNTLKALEILSKLDYSVFFVTNQAGLAEGLITKAEFDAINNKCLQLIAPTGIDIKKTYLCPHGEGSDCDCRKPKPGLLLEAAKDNDLDLSQSWMIGDRPSDILTGVNAGTKTILVKTGAVDAEAPQATTTVPTLLEAVMYISETQSNV